MLCIIDIETERLENPEHIWVAVAKEVETGTTHIFRERQITDGTFEAFASKVTGWIGHNAIHFDIPVLNRRLRRPIPLEHVIDTLVVSRLLNFGQVGGHSLESWGERLGCPKVFFKDFSQWSQEMEDYCVQDTEVTFKLYDRFKPYIFSERWKKSLRVEHDLAIICEELTNNGFFFDIHKARELHADILKQLGELDHELLSVFPPKAKVTRVITPRGTKFGTLHRQDFRWLDTDDLTPYSVGASFSLLSWEPFNPGSPRQIVERLNEAGWKPFEKTDGHIKAERELRRCRDPKRREELEAKLEEYAVYGWKCSEENLATLPETAPEAARKLAKRLLLDSRRSTLQEWLNAYSEADGRIHGRFLHIGSWTQRMSHQAPNQANITSDIGNDGKKTLYGKEMRSFWQVPEGKLLVGVDADSIQLRILAHYMDDPAFTKALVSGDKKLGTDAHSMNKNFLGPVCRSREVAKRFIYAWVLGAAPPKIAEILDCSVAEAREAMDNFLAGYPGLKRLKEDIIPRDARAGYFEGLDGRLVVCDNEHKMLAGYLQNGESVVMRHSNVLWKKRLIKERIPFMQVNFVHDEWQTEVPDNMELALYVANVQADSIRIVGEELGLRCPMAGSILSGHGTPAIGKNWSDTH